MRFGKDTYTNHSSEKKKSVTGYWNNLENLRSKIFRRCTKHFLNVIKRDNIEKEDDE